MYRIEIARNARRVLLRLPVRVRERIAEAISLLGADPRNPALDIRPLASDAEAQYRLRVGSYRVKFNKSDVARLIQIVRIGHRKDIYR